MSCIKEEGQAIALLPYTVLLCSLSSVLLDISLHSNFSAAVVSPSLIATSILEMEDLPICISSSLFAFFSLFFSLFSHLSASKSRGKLAVCIPGRGWERRVTTSEQAHGPQESSWLHSVHSLCCCVPVH